MAQVLFVNFSYNPKNNKREPMPKFNTLSLPEEMLTNLEQLGYHDMTAIQEKSLPFTLEGKDIIAQAKTGSGKTAAFGIGLLLKINVSKFHPQALMGKTRKNLHPT